MSWATLFRLRITACNVTPFHFLRFRARNARTLRLAVPCDLPPGPVDVVIQIGAAADGNQLPPDPAALVASLGGRSPAER